MNTLHRRSRTRSRMSLGRCVVFITLTAAMLTGCSESRTPQTAQVPISTASAEGVRAEVLVSPPAPTLADRVTIRVLLVRPAGERVDWPDWTSRLADWSIDAVAIEPPRRVAGGFVEAVTVTASPFLPGEYRIGPFSLHVGTDEAETLLLDAASITVAGPPPQTPLLDELLPAPAAATDPLLPRGIWLSATAICALGIGAGLSARRWSASTTKQADHDALADLERLAHTLRTGDTIAPATLDELDHAARRALSQKLNIPESRALCELAAAADNPAIKRFAHELDRARFETGRPSHEASVAIAELLPSVIGAIADPAQSPAGVAPR